MTRETWESVKRLFHAVMALEPGEREGYLASACADEALRREVRTLVRNAENEQDLPQLPAALAGVPAPLEPGSPLGAYTVAGTIGSGGMGVVYRATRSDGAYSKQVAVKVLRGELASTSLLARFRQERQILAGLEHPGIARLLDGGATAEGWPFLVMEYIDGLPIDQYSERHTLTTVQRIGLMRDVCAAVHYAHQHLVIHRDLKPGNILVTPGGEVKLVDFGIAKPLAPNPDGDPRPTLRLATPDYASPEQLAGETVSTASDVYSLGVLLCVLLTGRLPSQDGRLPAGLRDIVGKCLRPDPRERYLSAAELSEDLRRYLAHEPVLARKDTRSYRWRMFVRRNRMGVAVAALGLAGLLGGLGAALWQAHVAGVQRARAERRFTDVRRLANSFLFEFHDSIDRLAGSTNARKLIVQRALEYLRSLSQEAAGDVELQRELATAYQKVGDVQGNPSAPNLGDTEGALASQRAALAIRQALPVDRRTQMELSVSHDRVGDLLWLRGAQAEALEHYRSALAIRRALWAVNSGDAEIAHYLSWSCNNVADLLDKPAEALALYREGLQVAERAAALDPANRRARRDLSVSRNRVGDALWYASDFPGALEQYRAALAIRERLAAERPEDAVARRDLIPSYHSIGDTLLRLGQGSAALDHYRRAFDLAAALARADPNNAQAARDLAMSHKQLGAALAETGKQAEARVQYDRALQVLAGLLARDPHNTMFKKDAAEVHSLAAK